MKNKTISIRTNTKEQWAKIKNVQPYNCDICGKKLWQAPHGGVYCDETHDPITYANLEVKTTK